MLREVDKLDKRGADHVRETLTGDGFGLSTDAVDRILRFVGIRSTSHAEAIATLDRLATADDVNESIAAGAAELREVLELVRAMGVPNRRMR